MKEIMGGKILNKTAIMLQYCSDDGKQRTECSYCSAKRQTFSGEETGLTYHPVSFCSSKMRADDYEMLMATGFTRCGSYFYLRNTVKSCCETYMYKVDVDNYILTKNQIHCLKRFHRYLQTG